MYMFQNVETEKFIDPVSKEYVNIKAIRFRKKRTTNKVVNSTAKEIDIVSLENFGDVEFIMDIVEHNAGKLLDYRLDFNYITTMDIPNL